MSPSELYRIKDELSAWMFDRAVYLFGSTVDAELKSAVQGAKSDTQATQRYHRTLSKWLNTEQKFRDPAAKAQPTGIVSL